MDYSHDSEEYKNAVAKLQNEELLANELYSMTTTAIYNAGGVCFNEKVVQEELRDINFCGKEWIMEICRRRIKKELATICIG